MAYLQLPAFYEADNKILSSKLGTFRKLNSEGVTVLMTYTLYASLRWVLDILEVGWSTYRDAIRKQRLWYILLFAFARHKFLPRQRLPTRSSLLMYNPPWSNYLRSENHVKFFVKPTTTTNQ